MRSLRHGPMIVLAVFAAVAACVIGFGVYGLLRPPAPSSATSPTATSTQQRFTAPPEATPTSESARLPALPRTDDPVTYARAVANGLFDWDTMSGLSPQDYANRVEADADPSGLETPGLVADLVTYLPSDQVWQQLRTYQTQETFTVRTARIPADWPEVRVQAGSALRAGTTAVTVTGVRHRTGIWQGQPQSSADPVSFTVFLACRPGYPDCHVLRLSQLGKPLG